MGERSLVLLVNPKAGWGGLLGLGGSDGLPLMEVGRGPAHRAMVLFLKALARVSGRRLEGLPLIPAPKVLGELAVEEAMGVGGRWPDVWPGEQTLRSIAARFLERECKGGRLLVFSGGDGTALLGARHWKCGAPLLGVPGGSKMYSEVFALSPQAAARGAWEFLEGRALVEEARVVLVDEENLARGVWRVVEEEWVPTIASPSVRQEGKNPTSSTEEVVELVEHVAAEVLHPGDNVIIGPGGLLTRLSQALGWRKPFTAFAAGRVGREPYCAPCGSAELHRFAAGQEPRILLSPLGRSGFLLGRATRALTPGVLEEAGGASSLLPLSPPSKLALLDALKVELLYEKAMGGVGYLRVLAAPGEYWVMRVAYV